MGSTLINDVTTSHSNQVWRHMLNGKSITQSEALSLFGCGRLAGRIYDLSKRYNMPDCEAIKKVTIEVPNRHGKMVRVAKYSLNPDYAERLQNAVQV